MEEPNYPIVLGECQTTGEEKVIISMAELQDILEKFAVHPMVYKLYETPEVSSLEISCAIVHGDLVISIDRGTT